MYKLLVFILPLVAAKVHWGMRSHYLWRINIKVHFTLTYVLPGTREVKSINVDADDGITSVSAESYYVFKAYITSGAFEINIKVTNTDKGTQLFQFDWIEVKHNGASNKSFKIEIGKIPGPLNVYGVATKEMEDRRIIFLNSDLSWMHDNIDIHVTYFCVNYAFNVWSNAIGWTDPCYGPKSFGQRPNRELPYMRRLREKEYKGPKVTTKQANIVTTAVYEPTPPVFNQTEYDDFIKSIKRVQPKKKMYGKQVGISIGVILAIIVFVICAYIFYRKRYINTPN